MKQRLVTLSTEVRPGSGTVAGAGPDAVPAVAALPGADQGVAR